MLLLSEKCRKSPVSLISMKSNAAQIYACYNVSVSLALTQTLREVFTNKSAEKQVPRSSKRWWILIISNILLQP